MTRGAICFDLDDTLYEYHQYARAGLEFAAVYLERRTGRQLHDELLALYFIEETEEGTFDELVGRYDLPAELVDELVEVFHDATTPLRPYPAAEPVLRQLAESYRLGLITDGRGGAAKLSRLGLADWFDATLVTPTIGASKHEDRVFEQVCSELNTHPTDAVYVGDDPRVDFYVANELGLTTIRLRRGRYRRLEPETPQHAADHQIFSLGSLPGVVTADEVSCAPVPSQE